MLATISREDLAKLATIVSEEAGNKVAEKNYSMLESRIKTHFLKLGLSTMQEYWSHFKKNEAAERSAIQSLMTTHYTFFFREFIHFDLLEKWLDQEVGRLKERFSKTKQPVRAWSAACSRGQEVYSLASFLEVHLTKKHGIPFEVWGTDIDAESVAYAKNAVYPIKEVNTIPQIYLSGCFRRGTGKIKDFAAVHPQLKSKTHFQTLNLLEAKSWSPPSLFDITFCRNVFIYFSEENVQIIAKSLRDKTDARGLVVSGLSEPLRFSGWDLQTLGPSCYFNVPRSQEKPTPTVSAQPQVAAAVPVANTPVRKIRVLCVDDSPTIQTLIKKIFSQDSSYDKVEVANNGREAREKLNKGQFDLITLDIHMPEVTGLQFLESHYNKQKDPPVIMVSSVNRADLDLANKALQLGAFDYVEKPAMNNLQKSSEEILTKAKMALRSKTVDTSSVLAGFDRSLRQKIQLDHPQSFLRIAFANIASLAKLQTLVTSQNDEAIVPPLFIVWPTSTPTRDLEGQLLKWTSRASMLMRSGRGPALCNEIIIGSAEQAEEFCQSGAFESVSLQILCNDPLDHKLLRIHTKTQILVDESLGPVPTYLANLADDFTPATSFSSLSLEFFAQLRKKVA